MRIFIGIPASAEIQKKIAEWQSQFLLPRRVARTKIRWISPRNLHITLVPPWKTKEWQVESEKLKVIRQQAFEISFNQISFGPNLKEPRLIWARGSAPSGSLELRKKLQNAISGFTHGRDLNQNSFKLHMTLARFSPLKEMGEVKLDEKISWVMPVDRFVIYESHLLPQGAEYEILEEFRF